MAQEQITRVDYYGSHVEYHHVEPGIKGHTSSTTSARETLADAQEHLAEYVQYYQGIGCQITQAKIEKYCSHCNGVGKVYIRPKSGWGISKEKRCPMCKGRDSTVTVETWIDLPKEAFL